MLGTAVAVSRMPQQRKHSRAYLALLLSRPPGLLEVWRHFFAFEEALMIKLRVAYGRSCPCSYGPGADDFRLWLEKGGPMLLGTFHVGVSDLMGCMIGGYSDREVCMVRLRVGNSHDTDKLASLYQGRLRFIWINEPNEMLFALKDEVSKGTALAMQCDRTEHAARSEVFEFLGARRVFPFTIYFLSLIFNRSVLLSVGIPNAEGGAVLHSSPRFDPLPELSKEENLKRAKAHFQAFLLLLEKLLRKDPYLWFNFSPMMSSVDSTGRIIP